MLDQIEKTTNKSIVGVNYEAGVLDGPLDSTLLDNAQLNTAVDFTCNNPGSPGAAE